MSHDQVGGPIEDRARALADLVSLNLPVGEAIDSLRRFPWDTERWLVILQTEDARRVLAAYLAGQLAADEIELWANAIEGRDDIGFEAGRETELKDFVFELANPELTQNISGERAKFWQRRLSSVCQ
ncbi:MAG: hypothetical protein ACRDJU_10205 [Actinomycetota bacterium]